MIFLFVIGLEMKPSHLWHLRWQIFGLGSLQVVITAALLTVVGMAFGFAWQVSFVGAAGFVLTSTAIVMSVLGERNEIATPSGQKIVSILLFEDLLIVPLLAIVAFLSAGAVFPCRGYVAGFERGGAKLGVDCFGRGGVDGGQGGVYLRGGAVGKKQPR